MNKMNGLDLLFQYAREFKFDDFNKLFHKLEVGRPMEELWEAYLMRMQIRLYAADDAVLADQERVFGSNGRSRFPSLGGLWPAETPTRLNVFSKAPGLLRGFLQKLPLLRPKLNQWYGEQGDIVVRQFQGEIHYFLGEIQEALGFAEEHHQSGLKNNIDALLTQCLRFRCYLAMCYPRQAEACMLDMIRLSQAYPECQAPYNAARLWANLTTSWNGDSPRFYDDPGEKKKPVLEDRLESIRMGGAQMAPLEAALVRYAESGYESAYAMRQYYLDLFQAVHWFQAGDHQQTKSYFLKIYQIAYDSGVIMPLVEYGEQISPLLRYVKGRDWGCSQQWLDLIISRAAQYETGIKAYQDSDA